ncbi:MAG: hypothetical protein HYU86_04760 [Chloroflexi bacterium]|nr:hypothetical protein [Chloroflexota bacterium]
MAGPATTGNAFVLNNMEGNPVAVPANGIIKPGEELTLRMDLNMMSGMGGPHHFRVKLPVGGGSGDAPLTLELNIRGLFG